MQDNIKRFFCLVSLAALLAIVLAFSLASPHLARATQSASPWSGQTTDWANVRAGTNTSASIAAVYATVSGQVVWNGISDWYRISNLNSAPLYIYGGLVTRANNTGNGDGGITPSAQGKVIVVSLSDQWLYAYENGQQLFDSAVMTGRPGLETPTGTFHVFAKLSSTTFYSPWPHGSPYWYPPTHINYALEFLAGGFFLHDSWWHTVYGPGTNRWHYDPTYGWQNGSHGCVAMPLRAAAWLYNWAPIGTTVQIIA